MSFFEKHCSFQGIFYFTKSVPSRVYFLLNIGPLQAINFSYGLIKGMFSAKMVPLKVGFWGKCVPLGVYFWPNSPVTVLTYVCVFCMEVPLPPTPLPCVTPDTTFSPVTCFTIHPKLVLYGVIVPLEYGNFILLRCWAF